MKIATILIGAIQVIWGLLAAVSLLLIIMSPMMFDAPGSENNPKVLAAFYALLSFPVVVIACMAASSAFVSIDRPWIAAAVLLIPAINVYLICSW